MVGASRKSKICLATTSFPLHPRDTVQANFTLGLIDHLVALGNEITVFTHERPENPHHDWDKFRVHYFRYPANGKRISELKILSPIDVARMVSLIYQGARGLAELDRREKFDAILCLWAIPAGLYAYLASFISPDCAPYATWALGSDINRFKNFLPTRRLLSAILRRAKFRFADGLSLAEDVKSISGLDCEFAATSRVLEPNTSSEFLTKGPRTPIRFLYVGRHDKVKGTDVLIESLGLLSKITSCPDFLFEIVGEGPLTESLKARVIYLRLQDRVRFLGRISDLELATRYAQTDCVVIPSRSESIPVVLGEAVRFRKPLIVTDVGDMGRLVREYQLGEVITHENTFELANSMEKFCERPRVLDESQCLGLTEFLALDRSALLIGNRLKEMTHHESNSVGRWKGDSSLPLHRGHSEASRSG